MIDTKFEKSYATIIYTPQCIIGAGAWVNLYRAGIFYTWVANRHSTSYQIGFRNIIYVQ